MVTLGMGQTPAALKGRVTDPSEASVPGATVIVKAEGGKEQRVSTDEQGLLRSAD